MHYANCNTYNADFDGDEMNCHFPQDELSRAEAETIACTDEQYLAPTNGKPLRGLIQDHVGSGVKLTGKDCFLTRADFQHVLFCTLSGLPGVEVVPPQGKIYMPAPAIWKPQALWTGKQMVSAVLRHLSAGLPPLNLDFKAKTPAVAFGVDQEEHEVVVRGGELVRGVLDKAAFGASEGGLVHGVYEFYGPRYAGRLLTALGRLFTVYLQFAGHTCGVEDLVLTQAAEQRRRALIDRASRLGGLAMDCYTSGRTFEPPPPPPLPSATEEEGEEGEEEDEKLDAMGLMRVQARTAELLEEDMRTGTVTQAAGIDNFMRTVLSPVSSDIIRACLPDGLTKPFPHNAFSLMVSTGAKGSTVNQSQISCGLGQQELEGRRVPLMPSGKSLPSFPPHDPSPRAGGFIVDRFLTGVRPQEYYFHCMAGREGLIDTAVKTSRSGYLQRCLVKGLEELRVHYDHTVRDADAGVVQFLYGEDGVDPLHSKYLDGQAPQMTALARNYAALLHQYRVDAGFLERTGMDLTTARGMHQEILAGRAEVKQQQEEKKKAQEEGALVASMPLAVGAVVLAKRLKRGRGEWVRGAWNNGWEPAEVVKVRGGKGTYDLKYGKDGVVVKRVPRQININVVQPAEGAAATAAAAAGGGGGGTADADGGLPPPASSSAPHVELIRWPYLPEPVLGRPKTQLGLHLGAVSERFQDAIQEYLAKDPENLFGGSPAAGDNKSKAGLELLLWLKYMRSLTPPGEAVGSIAGQSIGEPSTQMTLNTFHLAGHGGANVTLGIPRLREIIMTASRNLKTPSMTVRLQPTVTRVEAQRLSARLRRLQLLELLHHAQGGVTVTERLGKPAGGEDAWQRYYTIQLKLHDEKMLEEAFGLSHEGIFEVIGVKFVKQLLALVTQELRKVASREEMVRALKQQRGAGYGSEAAPPMQRGGGEEEDEAGLEDVAAAGGRRRSSGGGKKGGGKAGGKAGGKRREVDVDNDGEEDEDEEEDEEDGDDAQGTLTFGRKEEQGEYGADEEEEEDEEEEGQGDHMSEDEQQEDEDALEGGGGRASTGSASKTPKKGKKRSSSSSRFDAAAAAAKIDHPFFEDLKFRRETGVAHITLKTRASHRRLLMVNLVETAADRCTVRTSKGITQAFVVEGKDNRRSIQTEGCNLPELWEMGEEALELGSITSNDIWAIHQTYGVEAARATIVNEIKGVFGAYGIAVDPRHLGLVADFMTYQGGFRALNRMGMSQVSSPFLQMSFETTATFLTEAALAAEYDNLETPSAKLVMGQPTGNGTGSFDLMVPVRLEGGMGGSKGKGMPTVAEEDRMEEA
jgi:DNA-directed RNA polymerase I subunit RPA1